ncbi:XRE family transcriptional regulator [Aeromicrobium phragmitis]|uniref:XRE family transcriptional regulator n=1 Tax=Aeromicrobium phragmitis TaxID=2478914 RepID=UPI00140913C6|nr:ImmA/IrrE family metallo-endopeptidase [Aeromicrobium phragmitis]
MPTGEYIAEWCEENGWTQKQLADRLGCSPKHVNKLIHGTAPLTVEFAHRLGLVTGTPPDRWMQIETFYRSELLRLAAAEKRECVIETLDRLPLTLLRSSGYITATKRKLEELLAQVFSFYQVGSLAALDKLVTQPPVAVAFRQSAKNDWAARATWLQLVEIEARSVELPAPYSRSSLEELLPRLREQTRRPPDEYGNFMVEELAACGVRLIFVESVPRAGTYGATRLHEGQPLIALSLHRKSEDQLWFTLFHELAHVLLHDLSGGGFVSGEWGDDSCEAEANAFAAEQLIPSVYAHRLAGLRTLTEVKEFAAEIGISPGIVVARLHREQLWPYDRGHGLIKRLRLVRTSEGSD